MWNALHYGELHSENVFGGGGGVCVCELCSCLAVGTPRRPPSPHAPHHVNNIVCSFSHTNCHRTAPTQPAHVLTSPHQCLLVAPQEDWHSRSFHERHVNLQEIVNLSGTMCEWITAFILIPFVIGPHAPKPMWGKVHVGHSTS